ncbi:MAG: CRISPR-associated endonuclease Cas1, partial [Methanothrix sp.]
MRTITTEAREAHKDIKPEESQSLQAKRLLEARGNAVQLVINSYGAYLRKSGNCFLVKREDKSIEVAVSKVSSILITTSAYITTDAIKLAVDNNDSQKAAGDLRHNGRPEFSERVGTKEA